MGNAVLSLRTTCVTQTTNRQSHATVFRSRLNVFISEMQWLNLASVSVCVAAAPSSAVLLIHYVLHWISHDYCACVCIPVCVRGVCVSLLPVVIQPPFLNVTLPVPSFIISVPKRLTLTSCGCACVRGLSKAVHPSIRQRVVKKQKKQLICTKVVICFSRWIIRPFHFIHSHISDAYIFVCRAKYCLFLLFIPFNAVLIDA